MFEEPLIQLGHVSIDFTYLLAFILGTIHGKVKTNED